MPLHSLLTLLSLFSLSVICCAASCSGTELDDGGQDTLVEVQNEVSAFIANSARWIDSFFGDPDYLEEENQSRARFKLTGIYDRFDDFKIKMPISLRLKLPHLDDKVHLLLSASNLDDFDTESETIDTLAGPERDDWTAGFRWLINESRRTNLSTTIGGSFSYFYFGGRLRHRNRFGRWNGRLIEQLRYYTDDGWENKLQYDLDHKLGNSYIFRTKFYGNWFETRNGFPHGIVMYLDDRLDEKQALRYEWGNYYDTSPSYKMVDLQFRARYRCRFYREWLVFEVAPELSFPAEYDQEINPGIMIRLEADFGYQAEKRSEENIHQF